jgi:hypothetical protein
MRGIPSLLVALALLSVLTGTRPATAQTEVDLALVVAVDISSSMDKDEQDLQREGFANAFRSPLVHEAIRRGVIGRIAVTYMEWSGAADQRVLIPWTVLDNAEAIMAFADRISRVPLRTAQLTSISGALDAGSRLHDDKGLKAVRRVIDVSGDGPNNDGRPVTQARDEAVAKGLIINGLPIMLEGLHSADLSDLDRYYHDCVIGGPGAFMVPARDREQFQEAIRMKILQEVSSAPAWNHLIWPAQTPQPQANCTAG